VSPARGPKAIGTDGTPLDVELTLCRPYTILGRPPRPHVVRDAGALGCLRAVPPRRRAGH